jgi:oxygen-independent coproporphyrinogen-3 oxidase
MACGLYIHIPFCLSKCSYCDFLSINFDEAVAKRYVEALKREIRLRGGRRLDTIYVGGGTPTVLRPEAIEDIFRTISDYFEFSRDVEVTIEANPGTLTPEKTRALASLGVNRLSVGVQSFNDEELRLLGRCHTAREAMKAIESPGFENFSVDLIYGIPGQDMRSWRETVKRALGAGPTHISSYELTAEAGTPFFESITSGEMEAPPESLVVEMFEYGIDAFAKRGLAHYEISNFARPGMECRHNLNYWKRVEYLGVGAGAHSFEGGRRSRNTGYVFNYIESLSKGSLPVEEATDVSADDEIKEIIFLGLRMTRGINVKKMRFIADAAKDLIEDGLLCIEGGRLKLTRKGLLLANAVAVDLFEKLGLG